MSSNSDSYSDERRGGRGGRVCVCVCLLFFFVVVVLLLFACLLEGTTRCDTSWNSVDVICAGVGEG